MTLRPCRTGGVSDTERDGRLLRKRIRLILTEHAPPVTAFGTLVWHLARRGQRDERARDEPEGR
ncbi:MAG: hypothetical protein DMD26_09700 [Gemmatimonadetes bacterium]|nr:MAG: hypothetical protein DMD26_09700 [Gemmatimonadota bacterium]